ncbi:hypothetical protein ACI2LF_29040 [Kribbella sp. NPDC020789]
MAAGGVVLLVVAVGWVFGVRHGDGPLGEGQLGSRLCFPVGQSEVATLGMMHVRNSSSSPVHITDVSLIDSFGVEYGGALLVKESVGSKAGWAFGDGPFDGAGGSPELAVDAELPANSPDGVFLAVQVRRPDPLGEGHVAGVRIEYEAGLRRYAFETGPEQVLRPGRCF